MTGQHDHVQEANQLLHMDDSSDFAEARGCAKRHRRSIIATLAMTLLAIVASLRFRDHGGVMRFRSDTSVEWVEQTKTWCDEGPPPTPLWYPQRGNSSIRVKVITYNLMWWSLFQKRHGNGNSAEKLLVANNFIESFDFMGFQECDNIAWMLTIAHMNDSYSWMQNNRSLCLAFRKADWRLLAKGEDTIAEDNPSQYFGKRDVIWMRLSHKITGKMVFLMNHHGPLPINSGGKCGGKMTASNIIRSIQSNAHYGDNVILLCDCNANHASDTMRTLRTYLYPIFDGNTTGGIDHIMSNVPQANLMCKSNAGSAGSDHDALVAAFSLGWPLPVSQADCRAPAAAQCLNRKVHPGLCSCCCDWADAKGACDKGADDSCCSKVCCNVASPIPQPESVADHIDDCHCAWAKTKGACDAEASDGSHCHDICCAGDKLYTNIVLSA